MTTEYITEVEDVVKTELTNRYGSGYLKNVTFRSPDDNGGLTIRTLFGVPYLDVAIEVVGREFVANYSNDNYSEHWFKENANPQVIADQILRILVTLTEVGAQQIDKVSNGILYSSTTRVGDADLTTSVKKIGLFVKKDREIKQYPSYLGDR